MGENLIYGADILAYGAIPDGKTDCTDAFLKAIENGENLISVPFGDYLITKPIVLNSNTKLHLHPMANIKYIPHNKAGKSFICAENASGIEICGGLFNIEQDIHCDVFSFSQCENISIYSCSVNASCAVSSFHFDSCQYINISGVTTNGMNDCIVFEGCCGNIYIKNCTVKSAVNVIQFGTANKPCDISDISIRNMNVLYCDSFTEFLSGKAQNLRIESINTRFTFAFTKLFENFLLEDALFEDLELYIVYRNSDETKTRSYFCFACCPDGVEIRNFKRKTDLEATPLVPTFIIKNTNTSYAKLIIDGMSLDNVIAARGKSKTVQMTTAKLSNPSNKYIYTLECKVPQNDILTLPSGDFDYLSIDRR
ncbi:MAG: hypothetical protein J6K12_04725 [Clostridia bacterium]|nr:hypothetical protein [Clostridia bacterium]